MLRFGRTTLCGTAFVLLTFLPLSLRAQNHFDSIAIGWSARLGSSVLDIPAIDTLRVYLPLRSGRVVALSLVDGRELWAIDLAVARGLAVDADRVFTATASELIALHAPSGRVAWRVPLADIIAAPAARAGWVLVGVGQEVLAFRADDGRLVWRRALPSPPISPAAIDGDRVYLSLADGSIVSLGVLDGNIAWRTPLVAPCGAVTAAGDRVFTGCEDNFFYALDADDGDREWRWRTGADVISPAAQDGERVYFASMDTLLRALDFGSGVQRWRSALDARPLSGPMLSGGVLLIAVPTQLRAVQVKDGKAAGTFAVPGELAVPPVFAPAGAAPGAARIVIVTGAATGDWRVYGLQPAIEPALTPLKEIPGRPLSPDDPSALPAARPQASPPLP